jgi:hypothetical protein
MSPASIVVDAYIPPNETHADTTQRAIARLAQSFGQHISLHHLRRLQKQCQSLSIDIPFGIQRSHVEPPSGHIELIPAPVTAGSAHFRLPCHPANVLEHYLSTMDDIDLDISDDSIDWAPGSEASNLLDALSSPQSVPFPFTTNTPQRLQTSTLSPRRRQAKMPLPDLQDDKLPSETLISIGPKTDHVMDQFGLRDSLLPGIRQMTTSYRSSRWATTLQSGHYWLEREAAEALADALIADLSTPKIKEKVCLLFTCTPMRR